MIQSIVLKILSKCNWNCSYCNNTNNEISPIKEVKYYIDKLQKYNPNIQISISGGEPGLLDFNYLDELFNQCINPIEVATNGIFLKNKYHIKFKDKISNISYHVIQEINKDKKIKIEDSNGMDVNHIIIVHKKNLLNIVLFMKINNKIKFTIKPYVGIDSDLILQPNDYNILYELIKDLNIDLKTKNTMNQFNKYTFENILQGQKKCSNNLFVPRIDLINKKIYRCCAGNSNEVDRAPLNKNVLNMIFKHNVFPCNKGTACRTCYHNFVLEHI